MLNFKENKLLVFIAALTKKKIATLTVILLSFIMIGNAQNLYNVYDFDIAGLKLKMPLSEAILIGIEVTNIVDVEEFRAYTAYGNKAMVQFIVAELKSQGKHVDDFFSYNTRKHPLTEEDMVYYVEFKTETFVLGMFAVTELKKDDPQEILCKIQYRLLDNYNEGLGEAIRRDAISKYGKPSAERTHLQWCKELKKGGNYCSMDNPVLYATGTSVCLEDDKLRKESEKFWAKKEGEHTKKLGF